MSAKDVFHEAVKRALQKEQWVITDDPLKFKFGNINFRVDLGAERLFANGQLWQFGKLQNNRFTKNFAAYTIYNLEQLFAALNYVFRQCELELEAITSGCRDNS